jgi:hypothetical protein
MGKGSRNRNKGRGVSSQAVQEITVPYNLHSSTPQVEVGAFTPTDAALLLAADEEELYDSDLLLQKSKVQLPFLLSITIVPQWNPTVVRYLMDCMTVDDYQGAAMMGGVYNGSAEKMVDEGLPVGKLLAPLKASVEYMYDADGTAIRSSNDPLVIPVRGKYLLAPSVCLCPQIWLALAPTGAAFAAIAGSADAILEVAWLDVTPDQLTSAMVKFLLGTER